MKEFKRPKPLVLIILDGWGAGESPKGNATSIAKTPNIDRLMTEFPHTLIGAAGEDVGLPNGQMGNSEVGHLNIGAGRIVYQDLTRITKAIKDGIFFQNKTIIKAMENVKQNNSKLHLMGLLSDGGVHSHQTHLYAFIKMAKDLQLNDLIIHAFLDGRDTPPDSGIEYVRQLENEIKIIGLGRIGSVSGRYYAMDRDKRWDRTKLAYDALVYGQGQTANSAVEAVQQSYSNGIYDEFIKPTTILKTASSIKEHSSVIEESDSIIFFNFRPDRARQLTRAFVVEDFNDFDRGANPPNVYLICLTEYDEKLPAPVAFKPENLTKILTDVLSDNKLKQLRIAETEKYAHVTYFFNGGDESPRPLEDWCLIDSPKVATYDLKPEMSAHEVTDEAIKRINSNKYDVIIMNYANPDMVGHTGILEAAIIAAEVVDECLGKVVKEIFNMDGEVLVTGDHGNLEEMVDEKNNGAITAHTVNKVPFIYITEKKIKLKKDGRLADIAPTILDILGLVQPGEMNGQSLLIQ